MINKQFQEEFDEARIYYDSLLDRELLSLFKKSQLTLSIAEGYTGGILAQRISKFNESQKFFKAALISSDTKTQINLFNISPTIIKTHGLISKESSLNICEKLTQTFKTDICISTLGTKHKESTNEDICFIGIKIKDELKTKQFILSGGLETKRKVVVQGCLSHLKTVLQNKITSLQIT